MLLESRKSTSRMHLNINLNVGWEKTREKSIRLQYFPLGLGHACALVSFCNFRSHLPFKTVLIYSVYLFNFLFLCLQFLLPGRPATTLWEGRAGANSTNHVQNFLTLLVVKIFVSDHSSLLTAKFRPLSFRLYACLSLCPPPPLFPCIKPNSPLSETLPGSSMDDEIPCFCQYSALMYLLLLLQVVE